MANEWNAVTVGDIFDLVNGYAFKSADFINSGVPVIKIKNVKAGEFGEHEFSYVTEDFLRTRANKLAKFGDLLISMSGNRHDGSPETWVGKVAQFRKTGSYFINQRVGALRVKEGARVDSRFASYVLSSFPYQELFIAIATSSGGQANLSPAQILSAPMRYPSLHEQRAIAHILGTLDDKIELNRKQNETLEAMARTLFKAWFVDFEPVRAKLEGRWQRGQSLPGMPAHLYDLFPDRLVESELGEIPQGWEVKKIGDVITRLSVGKKYEQKTVSSEGCVPVLDQGKSGIIGYHNDEPGVAATADAPVVVFANHTCYMRLISFSFSAIQNVLPFIGKDVSTIWAYYATFGKQSFVEYKGHWPDFVIHDIAIPPSNLTEQFAKLAHDNLKLIWENERESRALVQLRDTLLPKLISGELRVPDAERIVGAAV